MKNFLKEFKEFTVRGNVIDMAIGLTIGAAFGKVVASLVNDVIMPPIGILIGKVNFSDLHAGPVRYGAFLNTIIEFLIIGFVVFLIIKQINRFKRRHEPDPATQTKECSFCRSKISFLATRCANCTSNLT